MAARRAVFPGSFNPLTIAHMKIAESVKERHDLDLVDLAVSRVALAKEEVERPLLEHRVEVLHEAARHRRWLGVRVTDSQLIADIAEGYDLVIMGADKWHQVRDPVYYRSLEERDRMLSQLPPVVLIPRQSFSIPTQHRHDANLGVEHMSSTGARSGRREWMSPEAVAFDDLTGAWTDVARYERWLRQQP